MKPEKQRIAIAEICGWRIETKDGTDFVYSPTKKMGKGYHGRGIDYKKTLNFLPDYLNDKNAMQEARKVLTETQKATYSRTLISLTWTSEQPEYCAMDATAEQEAEAFLRTVERWEE